MLPAQAQRFALAQPEGQGDRPPGGVRHLGRGGEDAPGLSSCQGRHLRLAVAGRVDEGGDVAPDDAAAHGHAIRAAKDLMDHQDALARQARGGQLQVQGVQVLRADAVEPVPADAGDDPPLDAGPVHGLDGRRGRGPRRDGVQPHPQPLGHRRRRSQGAELTRVAQPFQLAYLHGQLRAGAGHAMAAVGGAVGSDPDRNPAVPLAVGSLIDRGAAVGAAAHRGTPACSDQRHRAAHSASIPKAVWLCYGDLGGGGGCPAGGE